MPVDARGLALATLAVIAVVFALDWAQAFVVSLLLGIVLAYTLNPLVAGLERIRIPRALASLVVMSSVLGALVLGGYSLRGQMQTIVEQLPAAASKFSSGLARLRTSQQGTMQKMQSAAAEVEKATRAPPTGRTRPGSPRRTSSSTTRRSGSATSCGWAPRAPRVPRLRRSWCCS